MYKQIARKKARSTSGFLTTATASIYSRGGTASIRQWLDGLQVSAIDLHLPATGMSEAKKMFHLSEGKLLVRAPIHANLQSSQAKALDRVVSVNGNDGSPEELLRECSSNVDKVVKLQRDRKRVRRVIGRCICKHVFFIPCC